MRNRNPQKTRKPKQHRPMEAGRREQKRPSQSKYRTERMSDANQVRINELARELEVKAKAIIDLLPGFGVTEKKTHSSSIPADVAGKVRAAIQCHGQDEA